MSEGSAVPASAKGSWSSFLKSMASFNGDLASMTAPPFILSSTSLVEYSAYWTEHPKLFVAPAKEKDPEKRALAVLKWFLSTLKQQYSSRNEKLGSEKKPLNPFLGELFLGTWPDAEVGETTLISEQVSHHPPVTAYCIMNEQNGMKLQGYNGQKAGFSGMTITVKQIGHAKLHIGAYNEDYLITLPSIHIEGLVYGSPYVELEKHTLIQSSSGYLAKIDYSGKGWVTGKKNSFTATLQKNGHKDVLYSIDGQWTGEFNIKRGTSKKDIIDSYNCKEHKTTPLQIAPLEAQDPLESRKAWAKVQAAINQGNYDITGAEKTKIENAQRELRKTEKEEGRTWERRYFSNSSADETIVKLSAMANEAVDDPSKTGGVWIFDEKKYENVKSGVLDGKLHSTGKKVQAVIAGASTNPPPGADGEVHLFDNAT